MLLCILVIYYTNKISLNQSLSIYDILLNLNKKYLDIHISATFDNNVLTGKIKIESELGHFSNKRQF